MVFFSTKHMANDDFSERPRRADSKNLIFIFSRILRPGHPRGPGVSLGRILGGLSIEPFLRMGGSSPRGCIDPRKPTHPMGNGSVHLSWEGPLGRVDGLP